ncbi:MAG: hypothetical protein ACAI38_20745 [Myxococcota bacterium]
MATNNLTRTQSYTSAGDGVRYTFQDVDGNGTFDRARLTALDAQGQVIGTTNWENLADDATFNLYKNELASLGLAIENEGQNESLAKLDPSARGTLSAIASALANGTSSNANIQGRWADFVSGLQVNGTEDVNALVQQVLREAYLSSTQDLNFYAQKVQFYNDLKKQIRNDITEMRKILSAHAGEEDNAAIDLAAELVANGQDPDELLFPWSGTPAIDTQTGQFVAVRELDQGLDDPTTKEGLSNYIDDLEQKLNSVGDDAQLANVDLQNMLQKQQQTLQMMSNISKMLHDTAMAVLRKISG